MKLHRTKLMKKYRFSLKDLKKTKIGERAVICKSFKNDFGELKWRTVLLKDTYNYILPCATVSFSMCFVILLQRLLIWTGFQAPMSTIHHTKLIQLNVLISWVHSCFTLFSLYLYCYNQILPSIAFEGRKMFKLYRRTLHWLQENLETIN